MGKFKPFLFGALAGASVIFVALQYHMVQTHDGFRVVPRTPQHSLGLAYADIRNWDAAKWSDRPELARALVANGSTDLVAGSIASDLASSVTSDSAIDQLRGSLNRFTESNQSAPDPLLDDVDLFGIRKENDFPAIPETDDLSLPFPQAQGIRRDNLFAENPASRTSIASKPIGVAEDIFKPSVNNNDDFRRAAADAFRPSTSSPNVDLSPDRETEMLEQFLFDEEPSQSSTNNSVSTQKPSSGFGMFEDVTGELESRANDALARARQGFQNEVSRSVNESKNSFGRYARGQVKSRLPDSVSSMFPDNDPASLTSSPTQQKLPAAIEALRNGFDPFIE